MTPDFDTFRRVWSLVIYGVFLVVALIYMITNFRRRKHIGVVQVGECGPFQWPFEQGGRWGKGEEEGRRRGKRSRNWALPVASSARSVCTYLPACGQHGLATLTLENANWIFLGGCYVLREWAATARRPDDPLWGQDVSWVGRVAQVGGTRKWKAPHELQVTFKRHTQRLAR